MSQQTLFAWAPSKLIYKGDPKCPRTVVVQLLNTANGQPNVFISSDKVALDSAAPLPLPAGSNGNPGIAVGIPLLDFSGLLDELVLDKVTTDIYARATLFLNDKITPNFGSGQPFVVGCESF